MKIISILLLLLAYILYGGDEFIFFDYNNCKYELSELPDKNFNKKEFEDFFSKTLFTDLYNIYRKKDVHLHQLISSSINKKYVYIINFQRISLGLIDGFLLPRVVNIDFIKFDIEENKAFDTQSISYSFDNSLPFKKNILLLSKRVFDTVLIDYKAAYREKARRFGKRYLSIGLSVFIPSSIVLSISAILMPWIPYSWVALTVIMIPVCSFSITASIPFIILGIVKLARVAILERKIKKEALMETQMGYLRIKKSYRELQWALIKSISF